MEKQKMTIVSDLLADPKALLDVRELEIVSRVKRQTLDLWRCAKRGGPPYIKLGRSVRYRVRDIMAWLDAQTVTVGAAAE